ncbi:hypothetical protein [Streptomyces melanogenes]|uniref:Uncharacterized protein n=1 Tax=Streptomyces melanogenes TaxID=67326 RepID=A0ABZ1XEF1_9ACTN|nr:hypothetical protein [Streptomyces melanogenes]
MYQQQTKNLLALMTRSAPSSMARTRRSQLPALEASSRWALCTGGK